MRQEYIEAITNMLEKTDLSMLDLIFQLLKKRGGCEV